MKKFKSIIVVSFVIFMFFIFIGIYAVSHFSKQSQKEYLVEINRYKIELQNKTPAQVRDAIASMNKKLSKKKTEVVHIDLLEGTLNQVGADDFFQGANGQEVKVYPLYCENTYVGMVSFVYVEPDHKLWLVGLVIIFLSCVYACVLFFLFYFRKTIIQPFIDIRQVPMELAKGHLNIEIKEEKSKYFGQFLWGISMLKDTLRSQKQKEYHLEKEKKMLLLSLSHDIKTPLGTIELYNKALKEQLYETKEEKENAYKAIAQNCEEIRKYIETIRKTSSEDLFQFEINLADFYSFDLLKRIQSLYKEKCNIRQTDLQIQFEENIILLADFDKALEIVDNLMENAFKYGDGNSIKIWTSREEFCYLIHFYNSGERLKVGEENHIFESFYRGENASGKQGNGLGLYISRQLAKKMNGELFYETREEGVCFTLVLQESN